MRRGGGHTAARKEDHHEQLDLSAAMPCVCQDHGFPVIALMRAMALDRDAADSALSPESRAAQGSGSAQKPGKSRSGWSKVRVPQVRQQIG